MKELGAFHRLFRRVSPQDRAVVFYAEHAGYQPYFEGILRELTETHRMHVCYITSDPTDPILQHTPNGIAPLGASHCTTST